MSSEKKNERMGDDKKAVKRAEYDGDDKISRNEGDAKRSKKEEGINAKLHQRITVTPIHCPEPLDPLPPTVIEPETTTTIKTNILRSTPPALPCHSPVSVHAIASPAARQMNTSDSRVRELMLKIIFKLLDPAMSPNGSFSSAFQALDTNRDGKLSADELCAGLNNWGIEIHRDEVTKFGQAADRDHDGFLSLGEFLSLLAHFNTTLQRDFYQRVMTYNVPNRLMKKKPLLPDSKGHEALRRVVFEIMAQGQAVDQLFHLLDRNSDGEISLLELGTGLQQMGIQIEVSELAQLAEVYDVNNSGTLGPQEFVAMLKDMNSYLQDYFHWHLMSTRKPMDHFMFRLIFKIMEFDVNLMDIFAGFDKNGDGLLGLDEFTASLHELGLHIMPEEAKALGTLFDTKKDGFLDISEFVEMISKINNDMQIRFQKNIAYFPDQRLLNARASLRPLTPNAREREIAQRLIFQCMKVDKSLVEIFGKFDKDGTHTLTPIQLADGILAFGVPITIREAESLIRLADTNLDGVIDIFEFIALIEHLNNFLQTRLIWRVMNTEMRRQRILSLLIRRIQDLGGGFNVIDIYRALDLDHDKQLNVQEFGLGLARLGIHIPAAELRMLFFEADENHDGVLTLDEFCILLKNSVESVSRWEKEYQNVMALQPEY